MSSTRAPSCQHETPFRSGRPLQIACGVVPNDVDVIPVSRWARESGRSEAEIEAALKAKGHRLMAPQTFSEFMEELEDRVLRGMANRWLVPAQP